MVVVGTVNFVIVMVLVPVIVVIVVVVVVVVVVVLALFVYSKTVPFIYPQKGTMSVFNYSSKYSSMQAPALYVLSYPYPSRQTERQINTQRVNRQTCRQEARQTCRQ